tara:strand:- start:1529 stop:2572 length:1044 start_codon:yes stop_codon:yes gene_type:complete
MYSKILDKSAWYGPEEEEKTDWIYNLDYEDIAEINYEADKFINSENDITKINSSNFNLPNLKKKYLEIIDKELKSGRGFALIRGMPTDKWDIKKNIVAYMGLCSFFGNYRVQNKKGHLLGHIKDLGKDTNKDVTARVYETSYRQTFHSDRSDIVTLLCLNKAKIGGESLLVSSMTIFNEILENHPDYLPTLFEPFPLDRRGEEGPGQKGYSMTPVYYEKNGKISSYFLRQYFESSKRFDEVKITQKQREALEIVDKLANDKRLYMRMMFEPGDIQIIYNHTLFHDRMSYQDFDEPNKKRHLLRLWISAFNDRELSSYYEDRWGSVRIGERGGVYADPSKINVPLQAN